MAMAGKKMKMASQRYVSDDNILVAAEKMKMKSQTYVSDDIIVEILRRLPLKSVLRFISVSKSWEAIITSSRFISAHHRHQMKKSISCSHLVHMNKFGTHHQYCTLISKTTSNEFRTQISVRVPLEGRVEIVGSCEGLVWLRTKYHIYVWNPFISTLKRIIPVGHRESDERLAFGFAPQSGDYRILKPLVEGDYLVGALVGAEMYSLSTDSWTKFKPPSGRLERYRVWFKPSKAYFKGSIYWFAGLIRTNELIHVMLRFDLDKEIIEEIEIGAPILLKGQIEITVINGFLVLLDFGTNQEMVTIVKGYIYKESESGSSSWTPTLNLNIQIWRADSTFHVTNCGHIIVHQGRPNYQVFTYEFYCDGKNLSFTWRNLGFKSKLGLTPIKETCHLLDIKNQRKIASNNFENEQRLSPIILGTKEDLGTKMLLAVVIADSSCDILLESFRGYTGVKKKERFDLLYFLTRGLDLDGAKNEKSPIVVNRNGKSVRIVYTDLGEVNVFVLGRNGDEPQAQVLSRAMSSIISFMKFLCGKEVPTGNDIREQIEDINSCVDVILSRE